MLLGRAALEETVSHHYNNTYEAADAPCEENTEQGAGWRQRKNYIGYGGTAVHRALLKRRVAAPQCLLGH